MSNNLDPDQVRHFVGPDLGPNCLQRLSAEDFGRQRVKESNLLRKNLTSKDGLSMKSKSTMSEIPIAKSCRTTLAKLHLEIS